MPSRQSEPIESREALEARYETARRKYGDTVPRPSWWGPGTGWYRTNSSSGRAVRVGCTIGCSITGRVTVVDQGTPRAVRAKRPENLLRLAYVRFTLYACSAMRAVDWSRAMSLGGRRCGSM